MAVREFDGNDDSITLSLGDIDGAQSGATSFFAIVKVAVDDAYLPLFALQGVSTRRAWWREIGNGLMLETGGFNSSSSADRLQIADDWVIAGWTKAAGTATCRGHIYSFSGATWTHFDFTDTMGDDAQAITSLTVGRHTGSSASFSGRMALVGLWRSVIGNDAAIEAANLESALSDWLALSPNGLWPLNQASVTTAVEDITGNGADQAGRVGTAAVTGDDPPGFAFNATVTGTALADLGALTGTATGHRTVPGAASGDLGALTATAASQRTVYGTAAADMGFTGTALAVTQGVAVADLGPLTVQATGVVVRYGTALADLGGLTAHAKGPITVTGVASALLGALTAAATGDRSRLPRFVLRGPTYEENLWTQDRLFGRFKQTRGTTLLMLDGVVSEVTYPYQEDLEGYDFVYLGGFEHRITSFEAELLTAAGYGAFVTPIR